LLKLDISQITHKNYTNVLIYIYLELRY